MIAIAFPDLQLDARRRLAMRHPLFDFGECRLGFGQFGLQIAEPRPKRSPEIVVIFFEDSLRSLSHLLSQPLDPREHVLTNRLVRRDLPLPPYRFLYQRS